MKFLFSLAVVFIVCPAAIAKWLEWRHSIGWSVELSAMFNNFWNEKKNKTTIGMYAFKLPTNKHPKQCIKIHFINCLLIIRMLFNSFKFYIGKLSFIYVVSKKKFFSNFRYSLLSGPKWYYWNQMTCFDYVSSSSFSVFRSACFALLFLGRFKEFLSNGTK